MVEHVGAVGVIDHQFELLGAGNVNGNGHRRVAAADDRTGKLLLTIDQHAELHAAAAAGRIVDAQFGLEALGSRRPHPLPLSKGEGSS